MKWKDNNKVISSVVYQRVAENVLVLLRDYKGNDGEKVDELRGNIGVIW